SDPVRRSRRPSHPPPQPPPPGCSRSPELPLPPPGSALPQGPPFRVAERTVMTATATRPSPVPEEGAAGSVLEPRKSRIKELLLSRGAMFAYVFILPYVLFFTVFRIGPALYGMVLSFGRYSLAGRLRFSGVDDYVRLFQDDVFWTSLRVTAIYALLAIPVSIVLSVAMAQLCNRTLRGMGIYRSLFFLPVVTSPVLSGIVFIWIFSGSGPL